MPVLPNKYHGQTTEADMDRTDWVRCWEAGISSFHKTERHPFLVKYSDILLNGRQAIKIFFPLCGKSVDMKWYYDLGHTVVGVEGAKLPVEEFFKTNSIEYTVESVDSVKGDLYQSLDKRIRLYLCDIFDFNSSVESSFDAVWDRGSFGAINKKDRQRYAELLLALISPNSRYLLDGFFYNEALYAGPPRNVTEEDLQQCFGSKCKIELLDIKDMLTPERAASGLDIFEERLWFIVPK